MTSPARPASQRELVFACKVLLGASGHSMTTYELVDALAFDSSLLGARSRQGRYRQLERALRSQAGGELGVVLVSGTEHVRSEEARRLGGRPPSRAWALATLARAA